MAHPFSLPRQDRREVATHARPAASGSLLALPLIAQHKAALLAARPHIETFWQHKLEPGREHVGEDGGRIIATDKELIYMGHNGATAPTEPNGGPAYRIVADRLTVRSLANAYLDADFGSGPVPRPEAPPTENGDDEILETYLQHRNITG